MRFAQFVEAGYSLIVAHCFRKHHNASVIALAADHDVIRGVSGEQFCFAGIGQM